MTSSADSGCGNPGCDGDGKFKCSACSTIAYCSPTCQKAHWTSHKAACKAARAAGGNGATTAPTSASVPSAAAAAAAAVVASKSNGASSSGASYVNPHEMAQKLHVSKSETQKAFTTGDFATAVKHGNEALGFAKLLPEPAATMECIQIHLNMTTAYLQLKNGEEAKKHSKQSVELSEKAMILRPGDSHAVEMLAVALGSRTNVLLNEGLVDEAEKHGMRAMSLAEKMYGQSDPRLFKYLRTVGLIREKQGKMEEAVKLLTRAFDLSIDFNGPLNGETQTVADELINLLFRTGSPANKDKALAMSRKCYELGQKIVGNSETKWTGQDKDTAEGALGDCAARYGTVLAKMDKETEAEPVMRAALKLREKALGGQHPAVAVCLGYLAGILEGQGKFGDETQGYLNRAIEIFKEFEGPDGNHVRNTMMHLQRVRMKREGLIAPSGMMAGAEEEEEEDDDDNDAEEDEAAADKPKKPASAAASSPASAVVPKKSASASKSKSRVPEVEFSADDGVGRMQHATLCFQMQEFARAEILLAEAFDIFLRTNGPSHASTAAAKQNLEVVRANAINKLWQAVVKEEIEALTAAAAADGILLPPSPSSSSSSAAAAGPSSPDRQRPGADGSSPSAPPSPNAAATSAAAAAAGSTAPAAVATAASNGSSSSTKGGPEVTWCKPQKLSPQDEWLFRETPKGGLSECRIC